MLAYFKNCCFTSNKQAQTLPKNYQNSLVKINDSNYKRVFYAREISTIVGLMLAIADSSYLYFLGFINHSMSKSIEKLLNAYSAKVIFQEHESFILDKTKAQLDKYFKKQLKGFSIPLKLTATDFQRQAWQELSRIPYGKTISYLDQAKNIGKPNAFRAVANANGKNPLSIIIPCHRVINSNGKLGGYTSGLEKKDLLLKLESRR